MCAVHKGDTMCPIGVMYVPVVIGGGVVGLLDFVLNIFQIMIIWNVYCLKMCIFAGELNGDRYGEGYTCASDGEAEGLLFREYFGGV